MLDPSVLIVVGVTVGGALLFFLGLVALYAKLFVKVDPGSALIVNSVSQVQVFFTGALVLPIVHRHEVMDISVKTVALTRKGANGVLCRDHIRADVEITFYIRVCKTLEDVLAVAQSIGTDRASDPETLAQLFTAKFSEALETAANQLNFEAMYAERSLLKAKVVEIIGDDLNGYVLDEVALEHFEQTPVESLDSDNILDGRGIRKITANR